MKIQYHKAPEGFRLTNDRDNREISFWQDWDYCGLATIFGWQPCTECRETDGTVSCAHRAGDEMILNAFHYLEDHEGEQAPDPGYFGSVD